MLETHHLPRLFDGAFGTYYYSCTAEKKPPELANLTAPETVGRIHREYLDAGADAIKTNTFGVNERQFPDLAQRKAVRAAGWAIACRAAAEKHAKVYADIGNITEETAAAGYREAADCFCALGARHFLFETLDAFEPLLPALRLIRERVPDATILVSFAVSHDGFTRRGLHYRTLLTQAMQAPEVDAAGLNCVCGPGHLLALLRRLPALPKPLSVMPNAGYPSSLNGRMVFEDNAAYFAEKLAELSAAGADILGGCCGTTPAHIRQAAILLQSTPLPAHTEESLPAPQPLRREKSWGRPGRKLLAVELDAPQTADCSFAIHAAARLRDAGADLITIADSPLSRARADSVMTAARLHRETGVEVMPHIACRDRNRIAIKASLLGAAFEGIGRVLAITGDPAAGSEDGVFSLNSFELIRYIAGLGEDALADHPMQIAGALNVTALNFDVELTRAQKKLDAGATMLLSQPIFSTQAEQNIRKAAQTLRCTLLAGILPVVGYKNALFLQNEVAGIEIPAALLEQLRTDTPEQAIARSVAYSLETVNRLWDTADGFYIMTPLRKIEIVEGVIRSIRTREEQHT